MQMQSKTPYAITIKMDFATGKPAAFRGHSAHIFARKLINNTIRMNSRLKNEKMQMQSSMAEMYGFKKAAFDAKFAGTETENADYNEAYLRFKGAFQKFHIEASKWKNGRNTNRAAFSDSLEKSASIRYLAKSAAMQYIIHEHLPTLSGVFLALMGLLDEEIKKGRMQKAKLYLGALGCCVERINVLSSFLDSLTKKSWWEIKALVENTNTRVALKKAGVEVGMDAQNAARLRSYAACLQEFGMATAFVLETLKPLLVEIGSAPAEKIVENGGTYSSRVMSHIEAVRSVIAMEMRRCAGIPDGSPQYAVWGIFEHHMVNSSAGMLGLMPYASKMPAEATEMAHKNAAELLRFLEIMEKASERDSPKILALVFRKGETRNYLQALEGSYT